MIISQTPLRIGLLGGGTDLPGYYREHGGRVLNCAIDKYVYVIVKQRFDDDIYVNYSKKEIVSRVDDLEHELVREAMHMAGVMNGVEITTLADIPSGGSGLGSSSAVTVGLLQALFAYQGRQVSAEELAERACTIEIERCRKPIGKQDQYMAAFGALTALEIAKDGKVSVSHPPLSMELVDALESNILLFYTGAARDAVTILREQDGATKSKDRVVVGSLREIKDIGIEIGNAIVKGDVRRFGELLDVHWQMKKRLSGGISSPEIDAWYELAKHNGAIGGKICGAGGGGFLMLYCEEDKHRLRDAMRRAGLCELNFRFEFEGSKVVFDMVSRDGRLAHIQRQERTHPFRTGSQVAIA